MHFSVPMTLLTTLLPLPCSCCLPGIGFFVCDLRWWSVFKICMILSFKNYFKTFKFWNGYRFTGSCKDRTEKSGIVVTLLSSVVTAYILIVQCQNQEIDTGTMYAYNSVHFTTFVYSCNQHCSQDTECFQWVVNLE